METPDYLMRKVSHLEVDLKGERHNYDKLLEIAAERKETLNELFSMVASEKERNKLTEVLHQIAYLSQKMRLECLWLKNQIANGSEKENRGSISGDLFIIEMEADEDGPVNRFDTDYLYGSEFDEIPDCILHAHRGLFHITTIDHLEIPVVHNCEWAYDAKSTDEIHKTLDELGFSKADIARIKQLRMRISHTIEDDTIICVENID